MTQRRFTNRNQQTAAACNGPRSQCTRFAWRAFVAAGLLALGMMPAACTSLGSQQLPVDRFDYNTAIANSANEQMLLNLVRLRFGEVPTFLAVNSVITQYVWTGEAGIASAGGENLGFPSWSVGGSVNARYVERPTVTYAPLSGQEFASQLINPVRADVVFSLVSSGWPPDQLLRMTLHRINEVENMGFADSQQATSSSSGEFARVVDLVIELAHRDAIELVRSNAANHEELFLDFAESADASTQAVIDDFKKTVGLEQGRSRFRVTRKIVGRAPDEVTLRMHSLLELMGLLSAGVETKAAATASDAASTKPHPSGWTHPMTIRCSDTRPSETFAVVKYGGQWFDLARSDEDSMRAFGLLIYLFQMQASQNPGAAPLLTVPIG